MKNTAYRSMLIGLLCLCLLPALVLTAGAEEADLTVAYSELIELPETKTAAWSVNFASLESDGTVALKSGNHAAWIDRLDLTGATYALELYEWLEYNANANGALADYSGLPRMNSNDNIIYYHPLVEFAGTATFAYTGNSSRDQESVIRVVSEKVQANQAEAFAYVTAVCNAFDRDHPEIFWLSGSNSILSSYQCTYDSAGNISYQQKIFFVIKHDSFDIRAEGYQSADTIVPAIDARDQAISALLSQVTGTTAYEKVQQLNRLLTTTNCYNANAATAGHDAHECISALSGRTGKKGPVCEGYARAFKVLCDKLEIPCVLVSGFGTNSNGDTEGHMWNLVRMEDENWYAVDVTWNDPSVSGVSSAVSGFEREDYLLVGSNTVVGGQYFVQSHISTNLVSDNGTAFTNEPLLAAEKYEAEEPSRSSYNVTLKGTDVTFNSETDLVSAGMPYTVEIIPDEGFTLPESVSVTVGGEEISGFTWEDGTLTIPAELITDDIVITAVGVKTVIKVTVEDVTTIYETFEAAWKALPTDGTAATLTLSGDVDVKKSLAVSEGQVLTLDGEGTLTHHAQFRNEFRNDGTLTICTEVEVPEASIFNYGTLTLADGGAITQSCIINEGTLTIEEGSAITGKHTCVVNNSTAVITGGNMTAAICISTAKDSITEISGGTMKGTSVGMQSLGTVKISGGTLSGDSQGIQNLGKLEITGGTVSGIGGAGIRNNEDGVVTIQGGTISGGNYAVYLMAGEMEINGGTVMGDIGIFVSETSTLTMTDGIVTAELGHGISNKGVLNLLGGTVDGSRASVTNYDVGTVVMSGAPVCTGKLDLYAPITISGALTGTDTYSVNLNENDTVAVGTEEYTITEADAKKFTCVTNPLKLDAESNSIVVDVVHTPGEAVTENVVEPTCTEKGSYETVVYCVACGVEMSRERQETDALGHSWSNWSVKTEATATQNGEKIRTCSVCGKSETQTIPATGVKENPFRDVLEDGYYFNAVQWAVAENVTTGLNATTFGPDEKCTRGQIVTFLWRAAGEPEPASSENPFTDVKSTDFCYKAVLWAVEQNITKGLNARTFGPNETCTRGQVATFLHRYAGSPEPTGTNPFADVVNGAYYYDAVLWAVAENVTTGMTARSFGPDADCTRGQIVTFLYRAIAE